MKFKSLIKFNVNMLTLSTPYQRKDRIIEDDECSQLRSTIEKNRKKVKNIFKTNVLVPKTNV